MAIYKEDIIDINLNSGKVHRSFLNNTIGHKDNNADRFGVRVFRDGEPENLSGVVCQAVFMAPDGQNIALTSQGTVSGNEAYVTLPQACYNVEGQFCLAIKLVGGDVTGTVRIVDGMVDRTGATGTVAPTETVPTYQEILAVYEDMQDTLEDYEGVVADQDQKISDMEDQIGDTTLPTTDQTITGAIAEHESDIEDVRSGIKGIKIGKTNNLIGNEGGVLYPVFLRSGQPFTISTSDSRPFGIANVTRIYTYRANRSYITYYELGQNTNYRTVTPAAGTDDICYVALDSTPSAPLMLVTGNQVLPYAEYSNPIYNSESHMKNLVSETENAFFINQYPTPGEYALSDTLLMRVELNGDITLNGSVGSSAKAYMSCGKGEKDYWMTGRLYIQIRQISGTYEDGAGNLAPARIRLEHDDGTTTVHYSATLDLEDYCSALLVLLAGTVYENCRFSVTVSGTKPAPAYVTMGMPHETGYDGVSREKLSRSVAYEGLITDHLEEKTRTIEYTYYNEYDELVTETIEQTGLFLDELQKNGVYRIYKTHNVVDVPEHEDSILVVQATRGQIFQYIIGNNNAELYVRSFSPSATNVPGFQLRKNGPLLPNYWVDGLMEKSVSIWNDISGNGFNGDQFVFYTDYHYTKNIQRTDAVIKTICDTNGIDKVFMGGDLINAYDTRTNIIMDLYKALKTLPYTIDKTYFAIGNHEHGNRPALSSDRTPGWMTLFNVLNGRHRNEIGWHNDYGDFWFDNTKQQIRYFVIGCDYKSRIAEEQNRSILEQLEQVPNGYTVVVVSHVGNGRYKNEHGEYIEAYDVKNDFHPIVDLLMRMTNHVKGIYTYTDEDLFTTDYEYDFTHTDAKVAVVMTGHWHRDYAILMNTGVPENETITDGEGNPVESLPERFWVVTTQTDAARNGTPNRDGAMFYTPPVIGTDTEQVIEVCTLDKTSQTISIKRIGAGNNRMFQYGVFSHDVFAYNEGLSRIL